jgi:hypothetical protein
VQNTNSVDKREANFLLCNRVKSSFLPAISLLKGPTPGKTGTLATVPVPSLIVKKIM